MLGQRKTSDGFVSMGVVGPCGSFVHEEYGHRANNPSTVLRSRK